jgi:hypothetical protein
MRSLSQENAIPNYNEHNELRQSGRKPKSPQYRNVSPSVKIIHELAVPVLSCCKTRGCDGKEGNALSAKLLHTCMWYL